MALEPRRDAVLVGQRRRQRARDSQSELPRVVEEALQHLRPEGLATLVGMHYQGLNVPRLRHGPHKRNRLKGTMVGAGNYIIAICVYFLQ